MSLIVYIHMFMDYVNILLVGLLHIYTMKPCKYPISNVYEHISIY